MKTARHLIEQLAPRTAFVALSVVLFAAAMVAPLDYDEEIYVAGAYFARSLSLYRDFIVVQPPVYIWVLSIVFDLVGNWYLLTARLVTWALGIGACALLYSLLCSSGTGRVGAFALVLGFVTSPFTQGPLVETRNDIMPLFFLLAALRFCFGPGGEFSRSARRLMLGGFFAAIAAATKYTYGLAAPVLAVALLYEEHVRRNSDRVSTAPRTGWFVAGAALGALPLVYSLAVHRERFVFETLQFHVTMVSDYYRAQGYGEVLTLSHKVKALAGRMLFRGNASILVIGMASMLVVALERSRGLRRNFRFKPQSTALVGLFCGALVLSTLAGPGMHAVYFAPVAALGALLAGRGYAAARRGIPPRLTAILLIVSVLPAAPAYQRYAGWLARSADLGQWTGVQTHRSAGRIAKMLAQRGASGHVATLFPIVVIDSNLILPEFAAGPFFFRSADTLEAQRVVQLRGVGPATLESLFAASPPAAIVGGFGPFRYEWNPPMDAALIDYAHRSGFDSVADDWTINGYRNGQVWIAP